MLEPKTPAVSSPALLETARAMLATKKPSSAGAAEFLRDYLRSRGWRVNNRSAAILEGPNGDVRVRFLKINVETERKSEPASSWIKTASQSVIDMALKAAMGLPELKETAMAALTARKDDQAAGQTKRKAKAADEDRERFAFKLMEQDPITRAKLSKAVRFGWPLDKLTEDLGDDYREVLERLRRTGEPLPARDNGLVSLENPPLSPLIGGPAYHWMQNVKGGKIAVAVESLAGNGGSAGIYLSASKSPMLSVHPKSLTMLLRLPFWSPAEFDAERGDAIGYIERVKGGVLLGVLSYIQTAEKKKGHGRWLIELFCRIMRGYGLSSFLALAPGDEGRPFLESLHQRGMLEILERTPALWQIKCPEGPTRALFPAPPMPELPEPRRNG